MKNDRFLEFYTLGFKNELNEEFLPDDVMLKKAYKMGQKHAKEGNDISSLDNLNDELVEFLIEREDISRDYLRF